ncbi:MAG: FAD-dependent oxidoreductase [Chloroflexi bacterium]|nr:FAD-dependent oxidoreductase [Chloroflexota bacterium]MBV9598575.1 FAD-dependent oxidoreductase [Chloroflexota bacterium]
MQRVLSDRCDAIGRQLSRAGLRATRLDDLGLAQLYHVAWAPGDDAYDEARKVWNGMIDRRPALIARSQTAQDVVASVNFARDEKLLIAVRGGAHNVAGNATCDDGIVIDLSRMNQVDVDPTARTARAQPGCTWADFDKATHPHGLIPRAALPKSCSSSVNLCVRRQMS